ncbi:MAG: hypothetical protein ABIH04_04310, partial [Planctomycetota bacterium]
MEEDSAGTLIKRLRNAEIRLRSFLALRAGCIACFYAICAVMLIMLMGIRVADGEHTLISYIVFHVTAFLLREGSNVEFLRTFSPPGFLIMLIVGAGAAFVAGVLARMLRPISLSDVALYLDAKAGTREQFVTAYELSGVRGRSALENYLVMKAANRIDSQRLYKTPAFLPPAEAWLQLMPLAVLVLLMLLGPYRISSPLPPEQARTSSAEEQQALEKVCKALEKRIAAEKDKKRKEELQRIKDEVEELKNEELPQKEKVAKLNELMDRIRRMSFESAREKAADMLEENELTRELG